MRRSPVQVRSAAPSIQLRPIQHPQKMNRVRCVISVKEDTVITHFQTIISGIVMPQFLHANSWSQRIFRQEVDALHHAFKLLLRQMRTILLPGALIENDKRILHMVFAHVSKGTAFFTSPFLLLRTSRTVSLSFSSHSS